VAGLLERPFEAIGAPPEILHPVGFTLALGLVAMLHTVLGEMVPKNLAIAGPERVAVILVPAHYAFCRVARPLLTLFNRDRDGRAEAVPRDAEGRAWTARTPAPSWPR